VHYYYLVQIFGFWEQLGRNRIVKNSRISGHLEPDIRYIPSNVYLTDTQAQTPINSQFSASSPTDFPFPFVDKLCILPEQTKTIHILLNTIQLSLHWTSLPLSSCINQYRHTMNQSPPPSRNHTI